MVQIWKTEEFLNKPTQASKNSNPLILTQSIWIVIIILALIELAEAHIPYSTDETNKIPNGENLVMVE
jgi:hypothetical protein